MLIRNTSTPACSSFSRDSWELEAGPTVATVFVRALLRDWTLNLHTSLEFVETKQSDVGGSRV